MNECLFAAGPPVNVTFPKMTLVLKRLPTFALRGGKVLERVVEALAKEVKTKKVPEKSYQYVPDHFISENICNIVWCMGLQTIEAILIETCSNYLCSQVICLVSYHKDLAMGPRKFHFMHEPQ